MPKRVTSVLCRTWSHPWYIACISAVQPLITSCLFMSHPFSINNWAMSKRPVMAANINGVAPSCGEHASLWVISLAKISLILTKLPKNNNEKYKHVCVWSPNIPFTNWWDDSSVSRYVILFLWSYNQSTGHMNTTLTVAGYKYMYIPVAACCTHRKKKKHQALSTTLETPTATRYRG